jgi:hypothetical protein
MRLRKLAWSVTLTAALAGLVLGGRPRTAPAVPPADGEQPGPGPAAYAPKGTASCSGRGCHGALEPRQGPESPVRLDEFTKWIAQDPHTQAYAVLAERRSQDIVARLDGRPGDPLTDTRCLACHSNPRLAGPAPAGAASQLARQEHLFGVGCESCHGGAAHWLDKHTRKHWQSLGREEKQAEGMVPVADVAVRTGVCAGCHVGAPPEADGAGALRDVNHDLIAAGHPRLNFEPSAFLANLPPHWNPEARKHKDEAQDWAVGQVACAEAAVKLLGYRARGGGNPWPELAEYDCYACHHDLQSPSWRQSAAHYRGRQPGALPWGDWYFSMPRLLAARRHLGLRKELDELRTTMERPLPGREQVSSQSVTIVTGLNLLGRRLDKERFGRAALVRLLRAAVQAKRPEEVQSWDTAEQLFQAAWSLNGVRPDEKLEDALDRLTPIRAFGTDFNSPRSFRLDSFLRELSAGLKHLPE